MRTGKMNRSTLRTFPHPHPKVPVSPPSTPHDLIRDQNRAAAFESQGRTTWAMARPGFVIVDDKEACRWVGLGIRSQPGFRLSCVLSISSPSGETIYRALWDCKTISRAYCLRFVSSRFNIAFHLTTEQHGPRNYTSDNLHSAGPQFWFRSSHCPSSPSSVEFFHVSSKASFVIALSFEPMPFMKRC
jgi:hypothetical protein